MSEVRGQRAEVRSRVRGQKSSWGQKAEGRGQTGVRGQTRASDQAGSEVRGQRLGQGSEGRDQKSGLRSRRQ